MNIFIGLTKTVTSARKQNLMQYAYAPRCITIQKAKLHSTTRRLLRMLACNLCIDFRPLHLPIHIRKLIDQLVLFNGGTSVKPGFLLKLRPLGPPEVILFVHPLLPLVKGQVVNPAVLFL